MTRAIKLVLITGSLLGSLSLTSCVSKGKYDTVTAENAQLHNTVNAQSAQIADKDRQLSMNQQQLSQTRGQLTESKGQTARLQSAVKYTVESDLLFKPGSWEMSKQGKDTISKMAKKLAPTQENKLVVIGYTDNQPVGKKLQKKGVTSNEELSQKRAEAVRSFIISQGVSPNMITAKGEGENNPVASNETKKGREQNRRVELSLGG